MRQRLIPERLGKSRSKASFLRAPEFSKLTTSLIDHTSSVTPGSVLFCPDTPESSDSDGPVIN